jgi:hypothetical protein
MSTTRGRRTSLWATFSWWTCGAQCLKIPANQQLLPVCGKGSLPLLPDGEVGEGPEPALTTDESEGLPGTVHRVMEPTANTRSRRRCSRPKNAEARWPFGPRASTPQRSHADSVAGNQDARSACPSVAPLRARVALPPKRDSGGSMTTISRAVAAPAYVSTFRREGGSDCDLVDRRHRSTFQRFTARGLTGSGSKEGRSNRAREMGP